MSRTHAPSCGCMLCLGEDSLFGFNQTETSGMRAILPAVDNPEYFHMLGEGHAPPPPPQPRSKEDFVHKLSRFDCPPSPRKDPTWISNGSSTSSSPPPTPPPRSIPEDQKIHRPRSGPAKVISDNESGYLGEYLMVRGPDDSTHNTPPVFPRHSTETIHGPKTVHAPIPKRAPIYAYPDNQLEFLDTYDRPRASSYTPTPSSFSYSDHHHHHPLSHHSHFHTSDSHLGPPHYGERLWGRTGRSMTPSSLATPTHTHRRAASAGSEGTITRASLAGFSPYTGAPSTQPPTADANGVVARLSLESLVHEEELEMRRRMAVEDRMREQEAEREERMRLEEILSMCAEYERQVHRGTGKPPPAPHHSTLPNRIKTNGSLPRDKRLAASTSRLPTDQAALKKALTSSEDELNVIFNGTNPSPGWSAGTSNSLPRMSRQSPQVNRSPYENVSPQFFQYPHSPRTRIKTTVSQSQDWRDTGQCEVIENPVALLSESSTNSTPRHSGVRSAEPGMKPNTYGTDSSPRMTPRSFKADCSAPVSPRHVDRDWQPERDFREKKKFHDVGSPGPKYFKSRKEERDVSGKREKLETSAGRTPDSTLAVNTEVKVFVSPASTPTSVSKDDEDEIARPNSDDSTITPQTTHAVSPISIDRIRDTPSPAPSGLRETRSPTRPYDLKKSPLSYTPSPLRAAGSKEEITPRASTEVEDVFETRSEAQRNIGNLKSKIRDLELQEEDTLGEAEMERALLTGELQIQQEQLAREDKQLVGLLECDEQLAKHYGELKSRQISQLAQLKCKVDREEKELDRLEKEMEGFNGTTDEETERLEKLKHQHEVVEQEKKAFEDLEFHQLETEALRDTEREERHREMKELQKRMSKRKEQISDIEGQMSSLLQEARIDTQRLEEQRKFLLAEMHQEQGRLSELDKRLQQIQSSTDLQSYGDETPEGSSDADPELRNVELEYRLEELQKLGASRDDLDRITQVTTNAPLDNVDTLGRKASSTMMEIQRNRELMLVRQGCLVIEEERRRVEALKRRVQSEVRAQWEEEKKQRELMASTDSLSSEDLLEKDDIPIHMRSPMHEMRPRDSDGFDADSDTRRPLSDASSCDTVRLRSLGANSQRPLTRYLPVRSHDFDLRQHIETAGHQIDMCHHIHLTSTSARGYLHKMGSRFKAWTKRWFVFDRDSKTLTYFSDRSEGKPRGGAHFQSIEEVYVDHRGGTNKMSFCVKTYEKTYLLMAPSPEAMRIWVDVIFTGAEGYHMYNS